MRTYNLLGVTEQRAGRGAEARAWYEKSRELAISLADQAGVAHVAHNIGIVWQLEGEDAHRRRDDSTARRYFDEARRSVEESLRIKQTLNDRLGQASSLSQLARIHLRLGDLPSAVRYADEARAVREDLDLGDVWKDYHTLSEIAEARGDAAAVAEWAAKRDVMRAELARRAGGGTALPSQMLQALRSLTRACAQAGLDRTTLGAAEKNLLAQLDTAPAPFPDFAAALRQLAAGHTPAIPGTLPNELQQMLRDVVQALRDTRAE